MRRPCANGLLQYCINVGPCFSVSFRDQAPVSTRSRQRGSAPTAEHGPEPGRRVPTGTERYERKPQCGETSHIHLCVFTRSVVGIRSYMFVKSHLSKPYLCFFYLPGPVKRHFMEHSESEMFTPQIKITSHLCQCMFKSLQEASPPPPKTTVK